MHRSNAQFKQQSQLKNEYEQVKDSIRHLKKTTVARFG